FSRALSCHDLRYAVLALTLSAWALRRLRLSTSLFLVLGTLFLCSVHGPEGYAFWSISRRLAVSIPVYVAIAIFLSTRPPQWRIFVLSFSVLLLGAFSAWFASGRWIA